MICAYCGSLLEYEKSDAITVQMGMNEIVYEIEEEKIMIQIKFI